MKILAAHVENHTDEGLSLATILVQEDEVTALIRMEHEWEDRGGETEVLWSEGGILDDFDLCDRVYSAEGYAELVDSRFIS